MRRIALALMCALPAPVLAEGGVLSVRCEILDDCTPGAAVLLCETIRFDFSPVSVGPDGSGGYSVTIDDDVWPATRLSTEGPFVWSEHPGHTASLLLPQGQTVFTLHEFDATIPPGAETPIGAQTSFLACGVF